MIISNLPIKTVVRWPKGIPESRLPDIGMECTCPNDLETVLNLEIRAEYLQIDIGSHNKLVGDRSNQIALPELIPAINQIKLLQNVRRNLLSRHSSGKSHS